MKGQAHLLGLVIATSVIIIISVLGIFWYLAHGSELQSESNVAFMAAHLPEFQCSFKGQIISGCIDLSRFSRLLGNEYFPSFGYSTITLEYITQESALHQNQIYNNEKEVFSEKKTTYFPVNVYDARTGKFFAGRIKAEVYR